MLELVVVVIIVVLVPPAALVIEIPLWILVLSATELVVKLKGVPLIVVTFDVVVVLLWLEEIADAVVEFRNTKID